MGRRQGVTTDKRLTGSERVRKFQTMLHAKAKEEPKQRFHGLCDKVWREDFLMEAWVQVRRKGGSAGVDGEGFKDIEAYGVEGWLGELARPTRRQAATSVALSEAQGEVRGEGALLGRETAGKLWSHLPGVEAPGLSVGEGMISTESRDAGKPHFRFDERG